MINKCHSWQLTINYYDIMCIMLEMAWITLQCTERLCSESLCKATNTSAGDRLYAFMTSDPAHCHGWGGAYLSAVAHLIPPPCSEHSALRLATSLSRCSSANVWHQVLNWNILAHETVAEKRTSAQTCTDSLALQGAAAVPSQLVCTILYSPSPCVSPPLSSIAMEKPCRCMYWWHLYKCTSLKKKMKPWHIWNKWASCVFIWMSALTNKLCLKSY